MKNKPILILMGDPKSIFCEIFFKSLRKYKFKTPLILIGSKKILMEQMNKFNYKKKIILLKLNNLNELKIDNRSINLIDIKHDKKDYLYLKNCFDISFKILRSGFSNKLLNGPITKTIFLKKKYLGITEYIANNFKSKKFAMLIYNQDLSVCPLTTHLPLKLVPKFINKNSIKDKVKLIDYFYKKNHGFKPKIAVTGLNPHCESILEFNEDKKIIHPVVKALKRKGYKIEGPFAADTIFLKQNRNNYDVILGMYHDQVLSPIKSIKEYDAFNITLGLPFLRVSPDHGPNTKMINRNKSNPLSLIKALKFLDQSD